MIDLILAIVESAATLLPKLIDNAAQTGELTPEQADEKRAKMHDLFQQKHWQTDAESGR